MNDFPVINHKYHKLEEDSNGQVPINSLFIFSRRTPKNVASTIFIQKNIFLNKIALTLAAVLKQLKKIPTSTLLSRLAGCPTMIV